MLERFSRTISLLCRWYWAVDGAELPVLIANQCERIVCQHKRERKVLLERQPNGWVEKVAKVNDRIMSFVVLRNKATVATKTWLSKNTVTIDGQLRFTGKSYHRQAEMLHIKFKPDDDNQTSPSGSYTLEGHSWGPKEWNVYMCISGGF